VPTGRGHRRITDTEERSIVVYAVAQRKSSQRSDAMTEQEWAQELLEILQGTAWRVELAKVAQDRTTTYAELRHQRSGEERTVRLSRERFTTRESRVDEIRRQLEGD
jgi:hypothetical protein